MKNKALATILIMFLLAPAFATTARADIGPKPSITINCLNLPGSVVYIDLLVDDLPDDAEPFAFRVNRDYDGEIAAILESYNIDGWRAALTYGKELLWGTLRREVSADGRATSSFNYFGIPDRFKVIIVTEDKTVTVSNMIIRKAFECVVNIDFSNRELSDTVYYITIDEYDAADLSDNYDAAKEGHNSNSNSIELYTIYATESRPVMNTMIQFLYRLITTFIIEGLILLLFGFSIKINWKPFLMINLSTQAGLTLIIALTHGTFGTVAANIALFVCEFVILIVEPLLFASKLKQHSGTRRATFAVIANLVSFFTGVLLAYTVYIR